MKPKVITGYYLTVWVAKLQFDSSVGPCILKFPLNIGVIWEANKNNIMRKKLQEVCTMKLTQPEDNICRNQLVWLQLNNIIVLMHSSIL